MRISVRLFSLATVLEEPELESAVAAEEAQLLAAKLDDDSVECNSKLDTLRSSRAGGDDGNEADEESSEMGSRRRSLEDPAYRKKCVKRTCTSSNTTDRDMKRDASHYSLHSSSVQSPREMIEIDLPAYPVVSIDCSTQVSAAELK